MMDGSSLPPLASLDPLAAQRLFGAPASGAIYLRGDNNLLVSGFNGATGVELAIRYRLLLPTGDIVDGSERLVPTTDRALSTASITMSEGWLLGVEVFAAAGTPRVGQCFVIVDVVRGDSSAAIVVATVLQGYATASSRLAWPGSAIRSSIDDRGVLRSIAGTDPAAGVEISETVPTNARWALLSFHFHLTTSAVVGNREVVLQFDDGATMFGEVPAGTSQAASLVRHYSYTRGVQRFALAAATVISVPSPDIQLAQGFRIRTVTTALDPGDNFSDVQYLVEEWIED